MLKKKNVPNPSHILHQGPVEVQIDLSYKEKPIRSLDHEEITLRNKVIPSVKVLWCNHNVKEVTWEREEDMKKNNTRNCTNFWGQKVLRRLGCNVRKNSKLNHLVRKR